MSESNKDVPHGFIWKEEPRAGLKFLSPESWFYKYEERGPNTIISSSESSLTSGWISVGFIVNIFHPSPPGPTNSYEGYRDFIFGLPRMFKDMEPVGNIDPEEDGAVISAYQDFESRNGEYFKKKNPTIREIRNKRYFKVKASMDTSTGIFYLTRFVAPENRKEELRTASTVLKSIMIT